MHAWLHSREEGQGPQYLSTLGCVPVPVVMISARALMILIIISMRMLAR